MKNVQRQGDVHIIHLRVIRRVNQPIGHSLKLQMYRLLLGSGMALLLNKMIRYINPSTDVKTEIGCSVASGFLAFLLFEKIVNGLSFLKNYTERWFQKVGFFYGTENNKPPVLSDHLVRKRRI